MIWKTHPIFNNYEVSNTGLIRSKDRVIIYNDGHTQSHKGHIIHPFKSKWGYLIVNITACKNHRIHKQVNDLVAETFIPNPNHFKETHHLDYNKENNNVSNLIWVSHKYNMQDKGKYYHKKAINLSSNKVEASNGSIGHKCPLCKTPIYSSSIMCINCRKKYWASHINGYKISPQQLIPILKLYNGNLSKTGRLFDTTSNTIVKFLKRNKLPYHSKNYSQH